MLQSRYLKGQNARIGWVTVQIGVGHFEDALTVDPERRGGEFDGERRRHIVGFLVANRNIQFNYANVAFFKKFKFLKFEIFKI